MAGLAELGVASSIIALITVGSRIIHRVNAAGRVPEVLVHTRSQLRLLIEKMDEVQRLDEERLQEIERQSALAEAVKGCLSQMNRLEELVNKLQPEMTDSLTKKTWKATLSVFRENEISKILKNLDQYKLSFLFHFIPISDKVTKKDESYYMVPSLQVSNYVERINLLESVKTVVQQMWEQQRRAVVVLHGMGGQGKSQLAMEYCRTARSSEEFRAIFWIDASSINSTRRSFESIASKIADPTRIFTNIEEKVAFVKDIMNGWKSRWLLVFDNYDAPSEDFHVAAFFPSSHFGTILVTSRHEGSTRLGEVVIHLTKMTEQESLELLYRRSKNEKTDENETGRSIVARLAFLPLAIDQAGAFINAQKLPLTRFLERFDVVKEEILKYTPLLTEYRRVLGDDEKETALNVFTTWELSFRQIQVGEIGEGLRSFLTIAAFFNTRNIGEDLFHFALELEKVPSWINSFVNSDREWDSCRYRKALVELSNLSLLNLAIEDTEQSRFDLHPLIADWLRLRLEPKTRALRTIETCYLLAKLIKSTDINSCSYAFRLYLLQHLEECLENKRIYLNTSDVNVAFATIVRDQFVDLLAETSRYGEGISLLEEALPIIESAYGKEHESTLDTVNNLGTLYNEHGKFAEAEKMYKRALAGCEKALGTDHMSTLDTVNNLGILYKDQGKLAQAEEMYKRALVGYEKALGKDHMSTLRIVNNIGILYSEQGQWAEAEEMYRRALAGEEKALGRDHMSTLATVNCLGNLYNDQEKLTEAEEMYKRALAGCEKALGTDHMSTLDTVNNLGVLYKHQGKFAKAEETYKRALAGREKALGRDHMLTLSTVNNLGTLYKAQGKLAEAEEMYKRALAGREKALGRDHMATLGVVNNLGILYWKQAKLAEAEEMYKRALSGKEKALGRDHKSTAVTAYCMALLTEKQEDLKGASEMFERGFIGYRNLLSAPMAINRRVARG